MTQVWGDKHIGAQGSFRVNLSSCMSLGHNQEGLSTSEAAGLHHHYSFSWSVSPSLPSDLPANTVLPICIHM